MLSKAVLTKTGQCTFLLLLAAAAAATAAACYFRCWINMPKTADTAGHLVLWP